jgi:hypothetical protein
MKMLLDPMRHSRRFIELLVFVMGLAVTAKPSNDSRRFDDTPEGPSGDREKNENYRPKKNLISILRNKNIP